MLIRNQREITGKLGFNSLEDINLPTSGGLLGEAPAVQRSIVEKELMLMRRYVAAVDLPADNIHPRPAYSISDQGFYLRSILSSTLKPKPIGPGQYSRPLIEFQHKNSNLDLEREL